MTLTNNNFLSKLLKAVLVAVMALTLVSATGATKTEDVSAATTTVKGCFDGYVSVYTNGSKAKLRICTFNQAGNRTSGKLKVVAKADSGAQYTWYVTGCNGISNYTTNITLPSGNTHYRVYIYRNGNSNSNRTKCYYWSVDFMSNCWH